MISRLRRTSWLRGTAAVAAGAATGTGFQPLNWWILVIPGLAALILLVRNASGRAAAGLGYLFGIGLFTTTISWVGVMGPPVAILLIAVMALWCLLAGWTIRCVSVLPGTPVWQAMVWTATEIGAATIPLGGFGWVRLAWTVVDTPWVGVLRWAGSIGTSFLVALASGLLVYVVSARGGSQRRASIVFVAELLVVALAGTMCVTVVSRDISHQRSVRTLVVQGGVDGTAGPYAMGYARSVTDNHLSQTIMALAEQRTSGGPAPDMVLWPENSTDIDPVLDFESHQIVIGALTLSNRPTLVGAVTDGPGHNERQTTSMWWPPSSPQPTSTYHKRNLVPFGEWIPARPSSFRSFLSWERLDGNPSQGRLQALLMPPLLVGESRLAWWSVSRWPTTARSPTQCVTGRKSWLSSPTIHLLSTLPRHRNSGRSPGQGQLRLDDISSSQPRILSRGW